MFPQVSPAPLVRIAEPFDDPDWLFELKYDGFRALAFISPSGVRLVSRKGHVYKGLDPLCRAVGAIRREAILDGELVCLAPDGRPRFNDLMFRRGTPRYAAFDLLQLDGQDLRGVDVLERKRRLREILPADAAIVCVDFVEACGRDFFHAVCAQDLEGIVAKHRRAPYGSEGAWLKIKNPSYSQAVGRRELFDRRRAGAR